MRRLPFLLAAAALLAALAPHGAWAASPFRRCAPGARVDCAIVRVPLDRTGRVAGTVPLHVVRVRAPQAPPAGTPRSAVVGLAGGPGQAAIPLIDSFYTTISSALKTRDLIVFDQRGTGASGLLRCRALEARPIGDRIKAIRECAGVLGGARPFYTTGDSVDDMEAVRQAAGVDRLLPFGTSYGTKVALAYAQRYPDRTERLVLDSLVDLGGPDPFGRDSLRAIPRVLGDLCGNGACAGITTNALGDLAALVKRLETKSLRGYVVGGDGRRRPRRFGRTAIFSVLLEGDFDPGLRAAFPAAVQSALAGDAAPMLRLAKTAKVNNPFPDAPSIFSPGLYTATTCEDGPLPWNPALSLGDRWRQVFAQVAGMPDSDFAPFDRAFARTNDTLRLCAPWPGGPFTQPPTGPLPNVPTLILGGAADLRTPIENDKGLAARLPRASSVVIPHVGHSVLDSDLSGCADDAMRAFFADKPVAPVCSGASRNIQNLLAAFYPPTPVPPRSISWLGTPRRLRGLPGRTVRAAELSFFDAVVALLGSTFEGGPGATRIGGLRGGRLVARSSPKMSLRLDRYSYVPGVWVSASLGDLSKSTLRLAVGGRRAARGHVTFRLRRDLITGRLGGRRVHLRFSTDIRDAVGGLYELRSVLRARGPGLGRCCFPSQALPPR
jgi:pimeloyl-ACP methyl ester carboxylesterase